MHSITTDAETRILDREKIKEIEDNEELIAH
jgi:hypothetical protein